MNGKIDEETAGAPAAPVLWVRRIGWFVMLWVVSISALGAVAYAIRLMIP